ncbi:MAG: glutathione S-transferase [Pseudomonadales bacterium]|nr:glutathione S-transferase [Pseudomonadales bacterium]
MTMILYHFPISHFCEKIRFALDYKGIDYKAQNLLPGLHTRTTLKISGQSSVPVIQHNGKVVHNSAAIITYLDEQFPNKPLTPKSPQLASEAKEWERYLDKEIGINLRRFAYHTLLDHPQIVSKFFTKGGPFWGPVFIKFMFPKLQHGMRKYMNINEATAAKSLESLKLALGRLQEATENSKFLVGDQFSRADLTAAALLAPLFMPAKYGLDWPDSQPEPLNSTVAELMPSMQWAIDIYQDYR